MSHVALDRTPGRPNRRATEQRWGARLPATIISGAPGCWTFRIDYSTSHWQETSYCATGAVLRETGGRTWQRFDFVAMAAEDTVEFTCDPPVDTIRLEAAPGEVWSQSCAGRNPSRGTAVTSAGSTTFIGREDVSVAGQPVPTVHYLAERTLTGDQNGVETTSFWFAADTGQVVRFQRDVRVESPSPIGQVTYTESGTYALAGAGPLTR